MKVVPVVDFDQNPLMPTTRARAERWVVSRKATYFWKHGVYCVRLNVEPSARETQPIVVGVDPGSKKEGFTIKSASRTYLNIQAYARIGIREKMIERRSLRSKRRSRNTPYRSCRQNRACIRNKGISPSTKARWQWKIRLLNWLRKIFPITDVVVEDIKARTKPGQQAWNRSFSPLEVGKNWFYGLIRKDLRLHIIEGFDTSKLRKSHNLPKLKDKMSDDFHAHCVDSWVMANSIVQGHYRPDNTSMIYAKPFDFRRRSLHYTQPHKGGIRGRHGGTISEGFKRGSLVIHPTWGLMFVGGASNNRVSLHSLQTGKRKTQSAKPLSLKFVTYAGFRVAHNISISD